MHIKGKFSIPSEEIEFQFARSSGPGGQNVNKVNSKAILSWDIACNQSLPSGVLERFKEQNSNRINNAGLFVIQSERFRDKPQNIKDCEDKLRELILAVWLAPKKRRPTKPSKAAKDRRIKEKKGRSDIKKNRKKVDY